MTTEIPTQNPAAPSPAAGFVAKAVQTRDMNLAACCLADDKMPRFNPIKDAQAYVEDGARFYTFSFAMNKDVKDVFHSWDRCVRGKFSDVKVQWVAAVYRALHY